MLKRLWEARFQGHPRRVAIAPDRSLVAVSVGRHGHNELHVLSPDGQTLFVRSIENPNDPIWFQAQGHLLLCGRDRPTAGVDVVNERGAVVAGVGIDPTITSRMPATFRGAALSSDGRTLVAAFGTSYDGSVVWSNGGQTVASARDLDAIRQIVASDDGTAVALLTGTRETSKSGGYWTNVHLVTFGQLGRPLLAEAHPGPHGLLDLVPGAGPVLSDLVISGDGRLVAYVAGLHSTTEVLRVLRPDGIALWSGRATPARFPIGLASDGSLWTITDSWDRGRESEIAVFSPEGRAARKFTSGAPCSVFGRSAQFDRFVFSGKSKVARLTGPDGTLMGEAPLGAAPRYLAVSGAPALVVAALHNKRIVAFLEEPSVA